MYKLYLVLIFFTTGLIWAQGSGMVPGTNVSIGNSAQSISLLTQTAETLYANELPQAQILAQLNQTIDSVSQESPGRTRELLRAQAMLLRATFYLQHDQKDKAEKDLEVAEKYIEAVFDPPDAIAYQMLANARSNLMLTRGILYIITNAGSINDLALKALQLDPQNTVATIIVAYGKIESPPIFGGNPATGREMLEKLIARPELERPYRFSALLGISSSWKKQNDMVRARQALELARQLYPENPELKRAME